MKRRILFVPMHLSTGGSPKWLLEIIKESMIENEVFVAEFNNYSDAWMVHKNEIINLIGKKSHECIGPCFSDNWEEERNRLWEIIEAFKPHVIHFNEIPENFEYNGFPEELLEKIYKKDRSYKILETCHSNSFDFSEKKHHPDGYVCVSDYHPPKIKKLFPDIPCYVWDYIVPKKKRPDRAEALTKLGLNPNKFHVLNVGLFHVNKNQKYIYDLAAQMLDKEVEFHFLGNECFTVECGIENLGSPNCRIWGERNDVDNFYSSMDLFLFPSKKELNPLCVKEALSWDIPVFMNKIESCDLYKKYENDSGVTFIDDINVKEYIESKLKKSIKKDNLRIALYTSFYNNARYIPGLYEQIRNQTYQNWKWFVTDDFGKDETVKRELMQLASRDKRVIYCDQKSKKEMFWNPQHFVTEDCDYLALIDADDGIYPKALEFLNHMLAKNPEAFSFSTWFHQYKENVEKTENVTNSDFSYPQGDWYTYLNKHEENLKDPSLGDFDWEYLRSFRFFGALRGHKNIKEVEIEINKPEKSVYEDSTRMSLLQKYGDYVLFPRPMYKVLNHAASHATPSNMDPEEHKISKNNLYEAIKKGKDYQDNKIINRYYPFFDELCALSLSGIHYEKDRKNLCLITNKPITKRESDDIQDLYFDHDFHVNTFNEQVNYFFLNMDSFNEDELKEVAKKIKKLYGKFEINIYSLLPKENKENIDKALKKMTDAFGSGYSWNIFCRNLLFKKYHKGEKKKKVLIEIGSGSLGDNIAWPPYAEEFRKKNNCDVYCLTYFNNLFERTYPDINFINHEDKKKHVFDKEYHVGWYDDTPLWVKQMPEQYTASHYLGLEHKEVKPKLHLENKTPNIEGKYVCIAIQSSSQCKYWNNPEGWNKVVKYLNEVGYKVVCIDKHSTYGGKGILNEIPEGAINKTGDLPIQERMTDLHNCEFFIGLGSGLSWLAWGLGKDVLLISGFSNEETEFYTPYRVINKDVCNSCWNKEEFDKGNWTWCPQHEGTEREFECSKKITFEMVKARIDLLRFKDLACTCDNGDWKGSFREVVDKNVYQRHVSVEDGDYVVDLGCSLGHLYFLNKHKNIKYVGLDCVKKNLGKFSSLLTADDDVVLMNKHVSQKEKGIVKIENNDFCHGEDTESEAISFKEILKLNNRKIDFLKFDIENAEVEFLHDDETYELLVENISKFSGELHFAGGASVLAMTVLKKLKNDKRVSLNIHSIDGVNITESFWYGAKENKHNYYNEVIISGEIL